MKKLLLAIALILSAQTLLAQGIEFESGAWNEVMNKAKEQDKLIFVDFYTSWCAPCKVVSTTVFPDPKIGRVYNEKFINFKIDAEKGEGIELAQKYEVKAYPTFLFIDKDGKVISRIVGGKTIKEFIAEAENVEVYAKYGGIDKMEKEYATSNNDSEFLLNYYELADNNKKKEIYNKYLLSLSDEMLLDINKTLIDEITIFDSKLFNRLVDGILKMNDEYDKDDRYAFHIRFATQYKLSGFIDESIKENNKKMLDEIVSIKNKLSALPRSLDGDLNIITGRGLIFASNNFIALLNTHKNGTIDEFKDVFTPYMNNELIINNIDTLKKAHQEVLSNFPPEFLKFMQRDFLEKSEYYGMVMTQMIETYWRNSPSDKKTINDCVRWTRYLFDIAPTNPTSAKQISALMIRFGKKKEAIAIIKECIAQHKAMGFDEKIIKEQENYLSYIENDKI